MEPDTLVWMRVIEVLDRSDGYDLDHFYVAILPGGGCVRSRGHEGDQSPDGLARARAPFPWDERRPFTPPVTTGGEKGSPLRQYLPYDEDAWASLLATQRVAAGLTGPVSGALSFDDNDWRTPVS